MRAYFFIACIFLIACENDPGEVRSLTEKKVQVEVAKNLEANYSIKAGLRARLKAPQMNRVYADTMYSEFPQKVHVDFFNAATGLLESKVDAQYGKYFESLGKVYLRDSVVISNMLGDTLYAKDLWWEQATAIIYSHNPVRVRMTLQNVTGTGFHSKADFHKFTIFNPRGDVDIPPGFGN